MKSSMYKKRLLVVAIGASLLLCLFGTAALGTQYKGGPFDPNKPPVITSFVVVILTDDDDDEELSLQPQSPLGPTGTAPLLFQWNPLLLKNGKRPQVTYALTLLAFKPEEVKTFNGTLTLDPDTLKSHLVYFVSGLSKTVLRYPGPKLQQGLIYMWFIDTVYNGYLFTSDKAGAFCYGSTTFVKPGSRWPVFFDPGSVGVLIRQVDLRVKSFRAEWRQEHSSVVIMTAIIDNLGSDNAPGFHVRFKAGGDSRVRSLSGLAAYTSVTLTQAIILTSPVTSPIPLEVIVDCFNEVSETNEDNNLAEYILY